MARTNTLSNFLTDVAAAIKTKKGSSTAIQASQFDTEILSIPSQGTYQTKTITIATNTTQSILPDTGYDAIDELIITTAVPVVSLQSKSYTFTSNQTMSLLPDTGYDGFSDVSVTINVPGTVKLFTTEQAMQNDSNPHENDLAIVYRNEVTEPSPGDTIDSFSLLPTVVFTTAITGMTSRLVLRGEDIYMMCSLDSSEFIIQSQNYDEGMLIDVTYTSDDGLTYTREDGGPTSYDLGENVTIPSNANTDILQFFRIGGQVFEGLYKYGPYTLEGEFRYFMDSRDTTDLKVSALPFMLPNIDTYVRVNTLCGSTACTQYSELAIIVHTYHLHSSGLYNVIDTCTVYQTHGGYLPGLTLYAGDLYIRAQLYTTASTSSHPYIVKDEYDFTLSNPLVSTSNRSIYEDVSPAWTNNILFASQNTVHMRGISVSGDYMLRVGAVSYATYDSIPKTTSVGPDNTVVLQSSDNATPTDNKYLIAPTQLTLNGANQLLSDIIGYGKNGVITGDGSIWTNLKQSDVYSNVYDLTSSDVNVYQNLNYNNPESSYLLTNVEPGQYTPYFLVESTASASSITYIPKENIIFSKEHLISCDDIFSTSDIISAINIYSVYYPSLNGKTIAMCREFSNMLYTMKTIDIEQRTIVRTTSIANTMYHNGKIYYTKDYRMCPSIICQEKEKKHAPHSRKLFSPRESNKSRREKLFSRRENNFSCRDAGFSGFAIFLNFYKKPFG